MSEQTPAVSNPNDRQVGGSHYRASYQHWDLVVTNNIRYLEAQITKYVTRWKKKNGVQDVEKSVHYLDKLESCLALGQLSFPEPREAQNLDLFATENQLGDVEKTIFYLVMTYTTFDELSRVRILLAHLLQMAKDEETLRKQANA